MIALRLAWFYAAAFTVIGASMPFWPLWLKSRGLSVEDIGLVIAIGITAKTLANPLIASAADQRGERKRIMAILVLLTTAVFAMFHWAYGFWAILAVTMTFHMLWSPTMPLMESLTMQTAKIQPIDYGRVRLWGSLTFIAAAWAMGHVLEGRSIDLVFWVTLSFLAVTFLSTLTLPDTRIAKPKAGTRPLGAVLTDRTFIIFVAATALIQSSHGVYYTVGTIHWQSVGHSEAVIGWLWAEGVIAEVLLFIWGDKIVKRFGAARLIAIGGLGGLIRWAGTGFTDALPSLMILQLLHGLSFGAAHLGAIYFIARRMAPEVSATAQSVYAAVVMGLAMGASAWLSGVLYADVASRAYLAMAVMSGLGAAIAFYLRRRD
ncbi:MAG: MFS transporter [Rhodospirillaceae bacterium]|jgi:MFS transporter, PPP family, 3-phenylpropionic acid transporter|nr:MFS transporter [Rhodospirillaceae bacterium]